MKMTVDQSPKRRQDEQRDERLVPAWRNYHYKHKTMIPASCGTFLCMLVWACCIVNSFMVFAATNTAIIPLRPRSVVQALRDHLQRSNRQDGGRDARYLAEGDFDSINAMLKGQSIDIPLGLEPPEISQTGFTLKIKSMSCSGFSIGDIDLLWNDTNNNNSNNNDLLGLDYFSSQSEIPLLVDLIDLNVACQGAFDFDYIFGTGTGIMNLEATNNDAQIELVLATTGEEIEVISATTKTTTARGETEEGVRLLQAAVLESDYPSMVPSSVPSGRSIDVGPDDSNTVVESNALILESDYPSMTPSSIASGATDKSNDVGDNTSRESDVPSMAPTTAAADAVDKALTMAPTITPPKSTSRDQTGIVGSSGQDDDERSSTIPTFAQTPPTVLKMSSCNVAINVTNLDFDVEGENSEYLQDLLNAFDMSSFLSSSMGTFLCDFLHQQTSEPSDKNDFLGSFAALVEPYLSTVPPEPRDPLVVEAALELPSTLKAVDFLNPTTALSKMASQAVKSISSVSFNRLITDVLLNENGEIQLDLDFLLNDSRMGTRFGNKDINGTRAAEIPSSIATPFGDLVFEVENVLISGLNTLREANTAEFVSLAVIGSHSLQVEQVLQDANIRVAVSVELLPRTSGENLVMSFPPQTVFVEVPVDKLEISGTFLVILDEDKVERLPMASLTNSSSLVECLASAIYTLELVALEMSNPLTVGSPVVSGLEHLSPGLSRVGETLLDIAFAGFGPSLSRSIPHMFETTLAVKINQFLDDAMTYNSTCTDLATLRLPSPYDPIAAETALDLPPDLKSVNLQYPTTSISKLLSQGLTGISFNKIMADHLLDANGEIKVDLSGIDFTSLMGEDFMESGNAVRFEDGTLGLATAVGNVAMNVEEAAITGLENITSMPELLMVSVIGAHHLKVQLTVENIKLRVLTKVKLVPAGNNRDVRFHSVIEKLPPQMITVNVPINHLALTATLLIVVDEEKITQLPMESILNNNTKYNIVDCLISTMQTAKLGELEISDHLSFGVPVISGADYLSQALSKVDEALGEDLVSSLTTAVSDVTMSPNMLRMFEAVITKSINTALSDSSGTCEESTVVAQELLYDPYAVEAALELPKEAINFANPSTPYSTWFTNFMTNISFNKLLAGSLLTDDGEILFDVGSSMNRSDCLGVLIDNFMGGESARSLDGSIVMETSHGNVNIRFEEIAVSGLGSLADTKAAEIISVAPASPHHLKIDLKLENAKIRVAGKVELLPLLNNSVATDFSFPPQTIVLEYPIESVTVTVMLLLVVDEEEILDLTVASMTNRTSLVGCLRSLVHYAELAGWQMMSPYAIGPPRLTGLDPEFIRFGGTLVESLLSRIDPSSSGPMLESSVSKFLQCVMGSSSGVCTTPELDGLDDDAMIDFREVFLPPDQASAYGFEASKSTGAMAAGAGVKFKNFLDSSGILGGLLGVDATDEGGNASIIKKGDLVSTDMRIPMGDTDTRIQLEISDVRLDNADSIAAMSLLNPVPMQAHFVNNSVTLGIPQKPLRIAASVMFGISSGNRVIRNQMNLQLDLTESHLNSLLMVRISQKKLLSLSVRDIMEKSMDCLLTSVLDVPVLDEHGVRVSDNQPSVSFHNVDFMMGNGVRNMTCVHCESMEFLKMSQLLQQPNEQEDAGQQFEKMINSIFSTLIEGDSSYVQNKIDQYLVNASKHCEVRAIVSEPVAMTGFQDFQSSADDSSLDYILALLIVMLAIMIITLTICVFVRWVVTRRHRKWLQTLSRAQVLTAYQAQTRRNEKEAAVSALSKSMFQSKEVNMFAKVFIPLSVLGNIALFLSGHLSPGGSIRAYVGLAGEKIVMDDVYNFSIAQSAVDLWKSDGKVLSTIMFIFSMFWPYLKQLVTLIVWFLPTSILSMHQRRKVLHDLDRLAKWSMVDVFVMIFMMVSFRVSFSSPSRTYLPDDMYTFDMMVAPLFGMYANMTAQLVSQVSSHFILQFQRRIEAAANEKYMAMNAAEAKSMEVEEYMMSEDQFDQVENGDSEEANSSSGRNSAPRANKGASTTNGNVALYRTVFYRFHREGTDGLVLRRGVNAVIIFGALLIMALVAAGCAIPSFGTDALGVVGVLVGLGRGDGTSGSNHSIFSVSKLLLDMTEFLTTTKDLVGLLSIAVLLVATTLFMPIAVVVAQLFRWFSALGQASRDRLDITIEILEAWQYVDVFVLTILLGIWQLGDVSEYMMNQYCGHFSATFAQMAHFHILSEEDAQCFKLQPSVQLGSYILLIGAVALAVLRSWMSLAVRQVNLQQQHPSMSLSLGPRSMQVAAVESLDVVDADSVKGDVSVLLKEIKPTPVLLTDRFRWVMVKA